MEKFLIGHIKRGEKEDADVTRTAAEIDELLEQMIRKAKRKVLKEPGLKSGDSCLDSALNKGMFDVLGKMKARGCAKPGNLPAGINVIILFAWSLTNVRSLPMWSTF